MRSLPVDLLLFAAPPLIAVALFLAGTRVLRLPSRRCITAIVVPMLAVALLVTLGRFTPEIASRTLATLGGSTVVLCTLTVFLLGVAWGAPKRSVSAPFLGIVAAIAAGVIVIQASGSLYWRLLATESWQRFPEPTGSLRQSSGASCAAASASMLLHANGLRVSEGELAYLAGTSLLGTDAEALVLALQKRLPSSLQAELVREWPRSEPSSAAPFVIFVGGTFRGHALFVRPLAGDELEVIDPLDGSCRPTTRTRLESDWDSVAIIVSPAPR